jgi:hypothetical protein
LRSIVRALVLNSTQPKHPHGGLPWVRSTLRAIEELAGQGNSFVASIGTLPWELALWKIARVRAPVHILCPVAQAGNEHEVRQEIERQFELDPSLATWHFLRSEKRSERLKDTWLQRDEAALVAAERIFPVSIRNGGKMGLALQRDDLRGRIDTRFQVPGDRRPRARAWQLPQARPQTIGERPYDDERMIVHFTRACDGPWPGESKAQFFASIAASPGHYPRDGLSTLLRILREGLIRPSTFRIRGRGATVSFTALAPRDALSLVRWRSRYARFAFEPYAIGLCWQAALRAGATAVIYDPGAAHDTTNRGSPMHQGRGREGEWEAEREWRIEQGVDLTVFDPSEVFVFTATAVEADLARAQCHFRVADFGCMPVDSTVARAAPR